MDRERLEQAIKTLEIANARVGDLAANREAKARIAIEAVNRRLNKAGRILIQTRSPEMGPVLGLIRAARDHLRKQAARGASKAHLALNEATRLLTRLSSRGLL